MLEVFLYTIVDVMLVFIVVPWVMIMAVPVILVAMSLGIVVGLPYLLLQKKVRVRDEMRVLLVDDSPNTLILMDKILKSRNCILKTVDSGIKAVEELMRERYDLMILDYYMPGMNGVETLNLAEEIMEKNRSLDRSYQIPVIEYSSGKDELINVRRMNHFTLVGKLSKNMPPSALRPIVGQIINNVAGIAV